MNRVVVTLGALVAAICLPTAATAASSATAKPGQLVINATGQTRGVLTVKHATNITLDLVNRNAALTLPDGTVTSTSPYVGVQLSQGHHVVFGFYLDHALPDVTTFGDLHAKLAAGRYDVTVLSSKPAVLRIPISGSGRYTVALTQRAAGTRTQVNAATVNAAQPIEVARADTRMAAGSTALLLFATTGTAQNVTDARLCLTTQRYPCALGSAVGTEAQEFSGPASGAGHTQATLRVYPGAVPPGLYSAPSTRRSSASSRRPPSSSSRSGRSAAVGWHHDRNGSGVPGHPVASRCRP
jgi:hypothetical protein